MTAADVFAAMGVLALVVWTGILVARSGFWHFAERDSDALPEPDRWPDVVAVIPARNEADVIAATLTSVLAQDYPGAWRVILVDDQSDDGTAQIAAGLANERLTILSAPPRPPGWTGKLWAQSQGIVAAGTPEFLWLTDADIAHEPVTLRRLVARASSDDRVMVSLMARLHCSGAAERALIPAFVYFFALLYPFARVNDRRDRMAAAAGGCVLVRRETLAAAGGIAAIRAEIIDDCALARAIKPHGAIWLGLTDNARSVRPYGFDDIRRMVARSAYAQLGYSPLALAGTLAGMALLFALPPLLMVFGAGSVRTSGLLTWLVMATTLAPILGFYRVSPAYAAALPLIGAVYAGFTLDSAIQHWRGKGGMWKGRAQARGASGSSAA